MPWDSPYNTYRNKGLTPGPIANPGYNSIMAALNPRDTTYYFYALNGSGVHTFFETYDEHRDFVSIWNTEKTVTTPAAEEETTVEEEPAAEEEPEEFYEEVPVDEEGAEIAAE